MAFEQVIPGTGQSMIAESTVGNPLVIDEIRCSSDNYFTMEELQTHPEYFTNGTLSWERTGPIISAGENDNTARIIGSFEPTGTEFNAHLICIFAHTQSSQDVKPLCWIYEQNDVITIPASNVTSNIAFNISVHEGAVISATVQGNAFISIGEWDRIVTSHKAGSGTSGDDQIIYGQKTFDDNVRMYSLKFTESLDSYVKGYDGIGVVIGTNSEPDDNAMLFKVAADDTSIDEFCVRYHEGQIWTHIDRLASGENSNIYLQNSINPEEGGITLGNSDEPFAVVGTEKLCVEDISPISTTITVNTEGSDVSIFANGDNKVFLGELDNRIGCVFTDNLMASRISSYNQNDYIIVGSDAQHIVLQPSSANKGYIGTASYPFSKACINRIDTNKIYLEGEGIDYAPRFSYSPTENEVDCKVGSFVLACGTASDFGKTGGGVINHGDRIIVSTSGQVHVAKFSMTGSATSPQASKGTMFLPKGTYIALNETSFDSAQSLGFVLLQRETWH